MYVNGKLMEGGMAERGHARQVFETIVRRMKDPALLEWVDGSTFKMRVFPLEGRQEKRIVLSYTQRLPSLYDRVQYRFPGGHSMGRTRRWWCHVRVKGGETRWTSDSLRWRPELPAQQQHERRDWVFLFESSADRDPLLARVQVDVIKTILENANRDDTFSILAAGTRVYAMAEKPTTPKNVRKAVKFLEQTHLVGALDLDRAFAAAKPLLESAENPYLVHVGSGLPALSERQVDVLVKRIPPRARYVGVGVGKRWSRALMKTAAGHTGGYFTQINPDEEVTWRAFELLSTLNTPRLLRISVVDNAERYTFLCHNDYLPRTWAKLEIDRLVADGAEKNRSEIVRLSKAMYVMSPFTSLLVLENDAMYEQYNVDRGRKDHWALYPCPDEIPVVHDPLPSPTVSVGRKHAAGSKRTPEEILGTVLLRARAFNPFVGPFGQDAGLGRYQRSPDRYGMGRRVLA